MKCKNCGADVVFGNKFCSECGVRLEEFMSPAPGEQQETESSDALKANIMSENSYEQTSAVSAQEDTSEEETYYSDSEEENLPEEPPRKKSGFLSVLRRNKAAVIIIVVCLFVLLAVCLSGSSGKRKSDKSDPERATVAETTISRLTAQDIPGTYVGEGGCVLVLEDGGGAQFYEKGNYGVNNDVAWSYESGRLNVKFNTWPSYDLYATFNSNGDISQLDRFELKDNGNGNWVNEYYSRHSNNTISLSLDECCDLIGEPFEYQTVSVGDLQVTIPADMVWDGNQYLNESNGYSSLSYEEYPNQNLISDDMFRSVLQMGGDDFLKELNAEINASFPEEFGDIITFESNAELINIGGRQAYYVIIEGSATAAGETVDLCASIIFINNPNNRTIHFFDIVGIPKYNHDGLLEMVIDSLGGSSYSGSSSSSSSNSSGSTSSSNSSGSSSSSSSSNAAVDPEFKALMDSYEEFFDDYIDLMEMYSDPNADYLTMLNNLDQIYQMIEDYPTMLAAVQAIDYNSLSAADYAYYMEVMGRITQKLIAAGYSV